mgnify:CR=1 FL=1
MANLLERSSLVLTPTAYNNGEALCIKPDDASGDFQFSRNSAATRVNAQGLVENVQILSSNLVQNPSFSEEGAEEVSNGSFTNGSTDWTLGTGWSIGEDKAICDGTTGNLDQDALTIGKSYKAQFTVSDLTTGALSFRLGGTNEIININSNGTYTAYGVADGITLRLRSQSGFDGSITNISVKEVGQDWIIRNDWSIEAQGVRGVNAGATTDFYQLNVLPNIGMLYRFSFEILEITNGSVELDFNNAGTSQTYNTIGVHTGILNSTGGNGAITFRGVSAFSGLITNISVIEITDDTNLPRINYEGFSFDGSGNIIPNSGCGSWLWEPQSTNLLNYSEDFSQWLTGSATTVSNSAISPSGVLNADKVIASAVNTSHSIYVIPSVVSTSTYTFSLYAKAAEYERLYIRQGTGASPTAAVYELNGNGSVLETYGNPQGTSITNVGNSWYRITLKNIASGGNFAPNIMGIPNSGYTASEDSVIFLGDGTSGVYIWGAQLEQQSYTTSYIPTSGSTVTRNQDVCNNGGSLASINSTEGVLYAEIARSEEENLYRLLGIDDGTSNNYVKMGFENSRGAFWIRAVINGVTSISSDNALTSNPNEFYKIAIRYKSGNSAIYINGTSVLTTTTTFSSGNFTALDFNHWNNSLNFFGKTKCVAVFPYLTDAELTELTTI